MRVSLIGLPGVGKSTVGRRLAKHLDVEFIDCDAVLERRFGESIASFFERFGEAAFRDAEQAFLQELVEGVAAPGAVIAISDGSYRSDARLGLTVPPNATSGEIVRS